MRWGLLEVSPENVVVSAVKTARDGSTVLRVYEAGGQDTHAATIALSPKVLSACEANLMEDTGSKVKVDKNSLRFDLHKFEIKTFKVRLQELKKNSGKS